MTGLPDHGTRARYNHRTASCRCGVCRDANARYMTVYRGGSTPPTRPGRIRWAQLGLFDDG